MTEKHIYLKKYQIKAFVLPQNCDCNKKSWKHFQNIIAKNISARQFQAIRIKQEKVIVSLKKVL